MTDWKNAMKNANVTSVASRELAAKLAGVHRAIRLYNKNARAFGAKEIEVQEKQSRKEAWVSEALKAHGTLSKEYEQAVLAGHELVVDALGVRVK